MINASIGIRRAENSIVRKLSNDNVGGSDRPTTDSHQLKELRVRWIKPVMIGKYQLVVTVHVRVRVKSDDINLQSAKPS